MTGATNRGAFHAFVYGRVQGVNFRAFTERCADQLGITGFVRNRSDGTVEVVAEGERPLLEMLLSDLKKGPRSSYVDDVAVVWQDPSDIYKDFRIRS